MYIDPYIFYVKWHISKSQQHFVCLSRYHSQLVESFMEKSWECFSITGIFVKFRRFSDITQALKCFNFLLLARSTTTDSAILLDMNKSVVLLCVICFSFSRNASCLFYSTRNCLVVFSLSLPSYQKVHHSIHHHHIIHPCWSHLSHPSIAFIISLSFSLSLFFPSSHLIVKSFLEQPDTTTPPLPHNNQHHHSLLFF